MQYIIFYMYNINKDDKIMRVIQNVEIFSCHDLKY